MANASFPTTPEAINPEWLTSILRESHVLPMGSVTDVRSETIAVGQGFAGNLARLTITYSNEDNGAPRSLIAKFPSKHQETKDHHIRVGSYAREVMFYREMAESIPMRTPWSYFTGLGGDTGEFLLLLEDVGYLRGGDAVAGPTPADTLVSLNHLASLYGSLWNDPEFGRFPWLKPYDAAPFDWDDLYETNWTSMMENGLVHLSDACVALGHQLVGRVKGIKQYLSRPPVTLLHGDFRLDNLFYGEKGTPDELVVLDWQGSRIGKASWDVAYFTSSFDQEAKVEAMGDYHRVLLDHGVSDYPWEQFLFDCRCAALDVFVFLVNAIARIDFSSPRGQILLNEAVPDVFAKVTEFGGEVLGDLTE